MKFRLDPRTLVRQSDYYAVCVDGIPGREHTAVGRLSDIFTDGSWRLQGKYFSNLEKYFTPEQAEWIATNFQPFVDITNVTYRLTK